MAKKGPKSKKAGKAHNGKKGAEKTKNEAEELKELKETLKRVQAEFENYQKRVEKEAQEFRRTANASLIESLLPVLDSLEQGLIHNKEFAQVKEQMEVIMKKTGLERIEANVGDAFNHDLMECMMSECRKGLKDGEVAKVLINGYSLNGRVLRHAKISINKLNEE